MRGWNRSRVLSLWPVGAGILGFFVYLGIGHFSEIVANLLLSFAFFVALLVGWAPARWLMIAVWLSDN